MKISRIYQDDCTVGVLEHENFRCFTLELPWLDNRTGVSCIPPGSYVCRKIVSPSLGECIEIQNVVERTYVRIHAGNYTSQIEGCVLVGSSLADINNDGIIDVANSRNTLKQLMSNVPDVFNLDIVG